jgi:outer membrane murein-binding lipoprotein Lpp
VAEARSYDSGVAYNRETGGSYLFAERAVADTMMADEESAYVNGQMKSAARAPVPMASAPQLTGAGGSVANYGNFNTAQATLVGDQFEFTFKEKITLLRQQSAMLPLVQGPVDVKKIIVLQGANATPGGGNIHPALSAELTNNTGMKLPAGPITIYDNGAYAGDALLDFLNEGEKRIVSWGDDMSVTGFASQQQTRALESVKIAAGLMTITRNVSAEKVYTVKNAGAENKTLVVEHPITRSSKLTTPATLSGIEQTDSVYRFTTPLAAQKTLDFKVVEETPVEERLTLMRLSDASLLSYSTNAELPQQVRAALTRAVELRKVYSTANTALSELNAKKANLAADQDRIRKNLEAAGNTSPQGQDYLKRLSALDDSIDACGADIIEADKQVKAAQAALEKYLTELVM